MLMQRIYLDYAASTPVDAEVEAAMQPFFGAVYANPSSLHWFGQQASAAVFRSRETIARSLGCNYKEIVFTGSATEANNLALRGVVAAAMQKSKIKNQNNGGKFKVPRVITSVLEHESVLETCRALEREGVEVIYIPVNREGIVDLQKLKAALNDRTVLVSIMHANNEVGTIQPIAKIAEIVRDFRARPSRFKPSTLNPQPYPLFHTDAAQSFQYLPCRVDELGVDLLTLSGQKMYGPKGVGLLYVRGPKIGVGGVRPTSHFPFSLSPVITGSDQEWGLRAGTENVPGIVGLAKAVEVAERLRKKESARVGKLRDYFWNNIKKTLKQKSKKTNVELNGSLEHRLPNNLNVYFPGHSAGDLLIALDLQGVAASPGAACRSRASKESYVVRELGFSPARASQSLRFSLGRQTTKADVDCALAAVTRIMK